VFLVPCSGNFVPALWLGGVYGSTYVIRKIIALSFFLSFFVVGFLNTK
jgi:hypothetical protein